MSNQQGRPHAHMTWALTQCPVLRGPTFGSMLCCYCLEMLNIFNRSPIFMLPWVLQIP